LHFSEGFPLAEWRSTENQLAMLGRMSSKLMDHYAKYRRAEDEETQIPHRIQRREQRIAVLSADVARLDSTKAGLRTSKETLATEIKDLETDVVNLRGQRERLVATSGRLASALGSDAVPVEPTVPLTGFTPGTRVVTVKDGERSSGAIRKFEQCLPKEERLVIISFTFR
jgi:hypothetical protein